MHVLSANYAWQKIAKVIRVKRPLMIVTHTHTHTHTQEHGCVPVSFMRKTMHSAVKFARFIALVSTLDVFII